LAKIIKNTSKRRTLMTDLIHWIKKQVADELSIYLSGLRNLSQGSSGDGTPTFRVGDEIEFEVVIKNNNPFPLANLEVFIHQVEAVAFEDNHTVRHIQNLASGAEEKLATIRGRIRANPDDAKSPWRKLDHVCRVTVNGEINLPPIEFHDEEFEVAHIKDA
jgi:hypothetical protein